MFHRSAHELRQGRSYHLFAVDQTAVPLRRLWAVRQRGLLTSLLGRSPRVFASVRRTVPSVGVPRFPEGGLRGPDAGVLRDPQACGLSAG